MGSRPALRLVTERFRIGALAAWCAVSRDAIRFYEREGLLPRPRRTPSRHRLYDQRAVVQVRLIRRAQELGLSLADIRRLLPLRDSTSAGTCRRVSEILQTRLEAYESRIASFENYRKRLAEGVRRCRQNGAGECRFLTDLASGDGGDGSGAGTAEPAARGPVRL